MSLLDDIKVSIPVVEPITEDEVNSPGQSEVPGTTAEEKNVKIAEETPSEESNIIDRKYEVDPSKMNYLKKLFTGQKDEDVVDLEMVQKASMRFTKSEYMGLIMLNQLNEYFKSPVVDEFVVEYMELRKYTKHSIGDLIKSIEVKNNKKLIEKTSIGMKV